MMINTCSGVISFAKDLEIKSSQFYESLSQRFTKDKELFLSFVRENQEYITQIERAYYGVITDALEGGFTFHLESDHYNFKIELNESTNYSNVLGKAIEIEEKIIKFYSDAAEQSQSLMADVPRAFKMVLRKRTHRLLTLKSLQDGEK